MQCGSRPRSPVLGKRAEAGEEAVNDVETWLRRSFCGAPIIDMQARTRCKQTLSVTHQMLDALHDENGGGQKACVFSFRRRFVASPKSIIGTDGYVDHVGTIVFFPGQNELREIFDYRTLLELGLQSECFARTARKLRKTWPGS